MRDLRDPQKLGEFLLLNRRPNKLLHVVADELRGFKIPNYPQDESMATITAREYRAELEAGAAAGDKYSQSALERLDGSS